MSKHRKSRYYANSGTTASSSANTSPNVPDDVDTTASVSVSDSDSDLTNDFEADMNWELDSKLEPGMLRFLAHVIEDGLQSGLRTQKDFIRHFPPIDIMKGLTERPDLRANILVPTTGIRPKIAQKKPAESAGQDLQIALDEGETDAATVVSLFHPDDRVRYLDRSRLWSYIVEPQFWNRKKDNPEFERAKSHIAFMLDRAIDDGLINYRDIVDGITVATLVQHLATEQIQAIIEKALTQSREKKSFTEQDMLQVVPSSELVRKVPLATLWERVVAPKIAEQHNLTSRNTKSASYAPSNGPAATRKSSFEELPTDQPGISDVRTPESTDVAYVAAN